MSRKSYVEVLESRRLLSVTAAQLAYPLTSGAHWTTQDDDGTTDAYAVAGTGSINGNSGTKVTDHTVSDGYVADTSVIAGFDNAKDFVVYGATSSSTDTSTDPPTTSNSTEYYNPYHVQAPAVMVAGHTYSYSTTLFGTDGTDSATSRDDYTITLRSDTQQKVTVPAGTFNCYVIDLSDTYTNSKGTTNTFTTTDYISPGQFPIKEVDTNTSDTSTTVLTSTNVKLTATKVAFVSQPTNALVGTALSPAVTVDVETKDNAIVNDDASTVTLKISTGPDGGTISGTTAVATSGGVATFSGLKFSKPGTYTLIASDSGKDIATDLSSSFKITTTAASKLEFGTQPPPANTDTKLAPAVTVNVENDDGSISTSDTSSVSLAIESGPVGGVIVGTTTVTAVKGVATFSDLSFDIPGTYTLKATDGGLDSAVSNSFTIISKAKAAKVAFTTQPTTTVAGKALAAVRVAVEFAGGAIVQNDTSTVTLALASGPAGATLGGKLTAAAVNGIATFTSLLLTKAGTYTLKATDGTLTGATSTSFTISAAAAAKLAFVAATPPSTAAGKSIAGVAVTVQDTYGNTVTTDTSKVTVALNSGTGTLAGTTTVAAKAGVATFTNLSLSKIGTYSLKASDGKLTGTKTNTFSVIAGAATQLVLVTGAPATVVAGKAFGPATVIDVEDALGNLVTTDTSKVTIAVATGGGTFSGTATVAAVKGVATFSNLILTLAGLHTFKATDGKLTAAASKSFTITPAAAAKLAFAATLPATTTAGKAISPAVVIDVEDAYGNIVKTDTSSVTVAVSTGPTGATVTGTVKATAKAGVATFSNLLLTKAGTYVLAATDGKLTAAKSSTTKVAAAAAAKLVFTTAPKSTKKNTAFSPSVVVSVEDAFGNVVATDKSKVTLAIASGPKGAVLSGTTGVSAVSGVATFTGLKLNLAGSYTLKVTDGILTSATSGAFTIT